jgi:hypothetical protein
MTLSVARRLCGRTQDGGESWREMPLPQGVQHIYALACG